VKLKNFLKAEEDCTSGILLNPQFVKSWSRRGTARNSLGRHRAALRDFEKALTLEPTNKKLHAEVRKTREAIKNCVRRTPRLKVPIREIGKGSSFNC
jgi:tetratricopeptide (TPR) repeat protein